MKRNQEDAAPVDITHVIPYMDASGGGPPVVVHRICERLAIAGRKSRVVTTDTLARARQRPCELAHPDELNYEVRVFSSRGPTSFAYSSTLAASIGRIVASSRLVHIHTAWSYPGLAAMRACRRQGVPYVVMPHGMFDSNSLKRKWLKKQLYGRLLEWPSVRAAAAMIYTHEEERRLAEISVPDLPAGVIVPLGADEPPEESRGELADAFFRRFPSLRDSRLVLFLSRLHPKKGLDLLIPAFRSVVASNRDAHLAIVGGGDERYVSTLRRLVEELRIADHVTFTGPLHGAAKWEAIAAAKMLVLPSYQENFALVVAEGMRMGLPIILSRRVNIWTDVVDAGAGLACDLTVASVAEAIGRLLADPALATRAGNAGIRLAAERFNWDRTAEAIAAAYSDVLHLPHGIVCEA